MEDNNVDVDADNAESTRSNTTDHVALDVEEVAKESTPEVSQEKKERQSSISTSQRRSSDRFDNSLLHRAVADAGRWAYGVMLVEVWVENDINQLFRPDSGWWIDPVFHASCGENCKVCRLTNPECKGYLKLDPLFPGEGLPGVLHLATLFSAGEVAWRDIKTVAEDPDQPWNPRLQHLEEIGLGWAAAVPFDCHGAKGIVVYMAKASVSMVKFQSSNNELYLKAASTLIGAAYALRQPRLQMQNDRAQFASVMRRVRKKIVNAHRLGVNLSEGSTSNMGNVTIRKRVKVRTFEQCKQGFNVVGKKVTALVIKSKGAGRQPPPAFNWEQTVWTFAGCFITLAMLCRLNVYLLDVHGSDFTIVLGPFGALVTLLYGLTSAPASQPRSAIAGQTVALTISIVISYADNMSVWMRQALGTSLAVATMAKLGVTHPPAGAEALLFASGDYGWGNMLFVLVGNIIAIGAATVINNFSEYRQYPIFWGLQHAIDSIRGHDRGKTD